MVCTFTRWEAAVSSFPAHSWKVLILSYIFVNTSAWILKTFPCKGWWACVYTRCSTSVKGLREIKRPVNGPKYSCVKAWRTQAKEVFNRLLVNWTSTALGRGQIQIWRMGSAKGRCIEETTRRYQSAPKAALSLICQQSSCWVSTGSRQRRILWINLMKWVQNSCKARNSGTEETCRENQRNLQLPNIFGCQRWTVPQYLPKQWSPPLADAKQFNAGPLLLKEWEITPSSPQMLGEGASITEVIPKQQMRGNFLSLR